MSSASDVPFSPRGGFRSLEAVEELLLRRFKLGRMDRRVIHHRRIHKSLYTVELITRGEATDILIFEYEVGLFNGSWGYIPRPEGAIRHTTCPPVFFEGVPVKDAAWRAACRAWASAAA